MRTLLLLGRFILKVFFRVFILLPLVIMDHALMRIVPSAILALPAVVVDLSLNLKIGPISYIVFGMSLLLFVGLWDGCNDMRFSNFVGSFWYNDLPPGGAEKEE